MAVHSLKDLPADLPDGLCLAAVTARSHVHDVFVSNRYASLDALPQYLLGTSSLRRRPSFSPTVPTLRSATFGATSTRGSKSSMTASTMHHLSRSRPHPPGPYGPHYTAASDGHHDSRRRPGALAIETRSDDNDLKQALSFLCDEETTAATTAERTFLAAINGSCQVPVGVYGKAKDGQLTLSCIIAAPDGSRVFRHTATGPVSDSRSLGQEAAKTLLDEGGRQILTDLALPLPNKGGFP